MTSCGFPHSEICESMLVYSSSQLIAVNHVLRRLSVPRHPPCALFSLTLLWLCFLDLIVISYFYAYPLRLLKTFCFLCLYRSLFYLAFVFLLFSFQGTSLCQGLKPLVGSSGLEPPTSRLSGVRSNHLSYEPIYLCAGLHLRRCWWR